MPEQIRRFCGMEGILSFSFSPGRTGLDGQDGKGKTACDVHDFRTYSSKRRGLMRWLDMPPVWLAGFVLAAWLQAQHLPLGLSFGGAWAEFLGGILLGGGLLLALLAITEMRRQKTTVLPHQTPTRLVQSGIFSRSRNPIYLGDVLILAGLVLWFDAVLSLPLIPVFLWVLEKRFVIPEEDRMRRTFRADWARYERKVRRWI